jgi:hypothetical protein
VQSDWGHAVDISAMPLTREDIDLLILIEEQKIPSLIGLLKKGFTIFQEKNS